MKENAIVIIKMVGPVHVQIQKFAQRKPRLQIPPRLAQPSRFFCQQSPNTSSSLAVRARRRSSFFAFIIPAPATGCEGFLAAVFDAVLDATLSFVLGAILQIFFECQICRTSSSEAFITYGCTVRCTYRWYPLPMASGAGVPEKYHTVTNGYPADS